VVARSQVPGRLILSHVTAGSSAAGRCGARIEARQESTGNEGPRKGHNLTLGRADRHRIPVTGELLDVVDQAEELPLSIDLGAAAQCVWRTGQRRQVQFRRIGDTLISPFKYDSLRTYGARRYNRITADPSGMAPRFRLSSVVRLRSTRLTSMVSVPTRMGTRFHAWAATIPRPKS
jgi:hypothetical protein